jgi:hypothetical protein
LGESVSGLHRLRLGPRDRLRFGRRYRLSVSSRDRAGSQSQLAGASGHGAHGPAARSAEAGRWLLAGLVACFAVMAVAPAAHAAGTSKISGKVTDTLSNPLSGVSVTVSSASPVFSVEAHTDSSGAYMVSGLAPGTYTVEFLPPFESTFAPQYYNGVASFSEATAVTILKEGEEKSGINAKLREGGVISGKVEGPHGEPVQGVAVGALGEFFGFAITNAAGEYTVTGLAKGSYKIEFLPPETAANLVPQYYNGASSFASATPVEVKEGEKKPNINAVLQEGGEITGTVTDAATHQPLSEVCVTATPSLGGESRPALTEANGQYAVHGLEKGSYTVEFEYCPAEPGVEYITQSVTGVEVTAGHATGISAGLVRAALKVETEPASAITPTTATLKGTVNPNGFPISECKFEYGTTTAYGKTAPCTPAPGSGTTPEPVAAAITGLSPNTTYDFKLVAKNAGGTGEGANETFKTPLAPPPTVETKLASLLTTTTATLNGTVNPNGGPISECKFEYGTTTGYGKTAACTPTPGSGTSAETVTAAVSGLTPNTTYDFKLVAKNAGGTGEGKNQEFKTQPNPPTLETSPASLITQTTVTLNGTVNPNGGPISECKFEYGTTTAYGNTAPCSSTPGSGTSPVAVTAAIAGLTPNTTYDFKLVAKNAGGTGEGKNEAFKTLEEIALAPSSPPSSPPASSPPASASPLPSPTPPPPPPPTIESVTQSHSTWSEGSKLATYSRTKMAPVGTTFSFVLNEQATVSFVFSQQVNGRAVGGKCLAQTNRNRNRPGCKRMVTQGTLSFSGHAGSNKVVFQGRISSSKGLPLGAYTLQISALSSSGQSSSPRSLNFTIVK